MSDDAAAVAQFYGFLSKNLPSPAAVLGVITMTADLTVTPAQDGTDG